MTKPLMSLPQRDTFPVPNELCEMQFLVSTHKIALLRRVFLPTFALILNAGTFAITFMSSNQKVHKIAIFYSQIQHQFFRRKIDKYGFNFQKLAAPLEIS